MCVILAVQDVFLALASGPAVDITFLWGCYCCICVMNISPSHQKKQNCTILHLCQLLWLFPFSLHPSPFPAGASPFQPDSLFISFCFLCLPSKPPQPPTLYLPTHPHLPLLPVLPVLPKTQAQTATTNVAYTPTPPSSQFSLCSHTHTGHPGSLYAQAHKVYESSLQGNVVSPKAGQSATAEGSYCLLQQRGEGSSQLAAMPQTGPALARRGSISQRHLQTFIPVNVTPDIERRLHVRHACVT